MLDSAWRRKALLTLNDSGVYYRSGTMNVALFPFARIIYRVETYKNSRNHSHENLSSNIHCIAYFHGRTSICYLADIFHNPLIRPCSRG